MKRLQLKRPLIVAPMAGGPSSPELVIASSKAGTLGSVGGAYLTPEQILQFASAVRNQTDRPFAINLFVPTPQPTLAAESLQQALRATKIYREELGLPEPNLTPPYEENFDLQFEAVLKAEPAAISFVFGLLPPLYMKAAKAQGIVLIGTATTFEEAKAIQESGADAVVLQGIEAGGHRGIFSTLAQDSELTLRELLRSCRKLEIPLIAAGGIMTAEDIQSVLASGAQAVQMGTAFLACQEAGTSAPYRARLLQSPERKTKTTRVFSGRLARGMNNRFMTEMEQHSRFILPFPAQNVFTRDLRRASAQKGSADFLSLWSGTGSGPLWQGSAQELIEQLFPDE